ncbi:hypothetical protein PWT90_02085 [Aphanocladium album]|nr:hypothetical protein PWT90_02085 [Aphanocladium album]
MLIPIALLTGLAAAAASVTPAPSATINGTKYTGLVRNGLDVFLGIRYATAARFQPPVQYKPPSATLAATDAGPMCPQTDSSLTQGWPFSEDCLRLNVLRPAGAKPGSKHAVMVFIHGGSYWTGSKDMEIYQADAAVLAAAESGQPIVQVNINYRLNVFGFAQHPDLLAARATNLGLRDQRLALDWVRANIASFGGDPSRVTIYGQSSGGLSVGLHILSHGGRSSSSNNNSSASSPLPFRRGIMQSQALEEGITGTYTADATRRILAATKCDDGRKRQIACLKALSTEALLNATVDTYLDGPENNLGDIWLPQVDGDFLPDAPRALIRAGRFHRGVDAIVGWTEADLNIVTPGWVRTPEQTRQVIGQYLAGQPASVVDGLLALYPSSDFHDGTGSTVPLGAEFFRTGRVLRDLVMVCPPVLYARHMAAATPNVFLYNWNQSTTRTQLGVTHGAEVSYVFGNLTHPDFYGHRDPKPSAEDAGLRDRATRSWSAFAASGRPDRSGGCDGFASWRPAFGEGSKPQVFVAGGPAEGMVDGAAYERLGERCAYIEKHVNTD